MNCWIVLAGWTTFTSRHRLRRASAHADFELRADPWRAFHRVPALDQRKGIHALKFETLRKTKAKLSEIVNCLGKDKSVVITKNRKPCAVLLPVTEKTDLESTEVGSR